MRLENSQVRVSQVVFEPGVPRDGYVRPTAQVVVFLDDCRYQRVDAETGAKLVRSRKSGDVLWHEAGEHAPTLINMGEAPFRTLIIEVLE
jgi:hypothetical protein